MNTAGSDQLASANEYLQRHRIPELLQHLTALLVYNQPNAPKNFILQELVKIRQHRKDTGEYFTPMYTQQDLSGVFKIYDINNTGFITYEQYESAISNLGSNKFNTDPVGKDMNKIQLETFLQEATQALKK